MEFKRIKKELAKQNKRVEAEAIARARAAKTLEELDDVAERELGRKITTIKTRDTKEARARLIAAISRKRERETEKELQRVDDIANAETCTYFKLTIDWTTGGCYGWQPRANLATCINYYEGKKTGGCGYDKGSTAAANVLNLAPEILKTLYEQEEKRLSKRNKPSRRDFIGYGCFDAYNNWYFLPKFEGGVGIESHITILKNCGYNVDWVSAKYADVIIGKLKKSK